MVAGCMVAKAWRFGFVVAALGYGFVLILQQRSRGLFLYPGTLDLVMDSNRLWFWSGLAGVMLGTGLGGFLGRQTLDGGPAKGLLWTTAILLICSGVYCALSLRSDPNSWSAWPFTRHYYLFGLGAICLLLANPGGKNES
jgi:hypothetical protein